MSAEEFEDVFDAGDEAEEAEQPETEGVDTGEDDETPEPDTDQETAEADEGDDDLPPGFMTKEEWVAKGNDPKDWRSPEVFLERGRAIARERELRQEYESRFENLNTLHRAQLEIQRNELIAKRDAAVEEADLNKVRGYDKQIEALNDKARLLPQAQQQPQQVQKPQVVTEWEQRNPWINDPSDERTLVAQQIFTEQLANTQDPAKAIAAVDRYFARPKPKTNRTEAPTSRQAGTQKTGVTMASLTSEERKIWDSGMFGSDKKAFLKAVEDDRKGAK